MVYARFEVMGQIIDQPKMIVSRNGTPGFSSGIGIKKFLHREADTYEATTDFYDCEYWGADADEFAALCKKGNRISLKGELKQEKWTDANGSQRRKAVLKIKKVELAD